MTKRTFSINVFGFGGEYVVSSKEELSQAISSNVNRKTVVSAKKVQEAWEGKETCIFSQTRYGKWEVKAKITEVTATRKLESIESRIKAEVKKITETFISTGEMNMRRAQQLKNRADKLGFSL